MPTPWPAPTARPTRHGRWFSRRVHDPKHPGADAEGYVTYSNVNSVEEMVNMISASRSYQNNLEVMNAAKSLLLKTLQMGQS
jgi:flagellar basal-body rod protein FlgC